jgi:hypothetical protein
MDVKRMIIWMRNVCYIRTWRELYVWQLKTHKEWEIYLMVDYIEDMVIMGLRLCH